MFPDHRQQRPTTPTQRCFRAPFGDVHSRLLGDELVQDLVVREEGELVGDLAPHGARRRRFGQVQPRHAVVSSESAHHSSPSAHKPLTA